MALTQRFAVFSGEDGEPDIVTGAEALALVLDPRPSWMDNAACRGRPEVNFFPASGVSCAAAKAVCAGCLVARDCLDFAQANGEHDGVWGGLSPQERRVARSGAAA